MNCLTNGCGFVGRIVKNDGDIRRQLLKKMAGKGSNVFIKQLLPTAMKRLNEREKSRKIRFRFGKMAPESKRERYQENVRKCCAFT